MHHRRPRRVIHGEPEPGREADRAENAKVVLAEPLRRVAHGPHHPAPQIHLALKRVAPLVPKRMVRDGVDREVAAGEIVVERDAEADHRMPAIGGTSRRKVVTSCTTRRRSITPTVPYFSPTGAVRLKSDCTWAGVAAVARS